MSSMEFEQNQQAAARYKLKLQNQGAPKIIQYLIRIGVVKNSAQGGMVLLGISIVCIFLGGYILYNSVFEKTEIVPQAEEIINSMKIIK